MPLLEKISNRLASWKGRLLSLAGRLTLVNAVISALPSHFMSLFKLPVWVIREIDSLRRGFLWKGKEAVSGFHCLVSWKKVCLPKKEGGLGVLCLSTLNKAFLCKWIWKLIWPGCSAPWKLLASRSYYRKRLGGVRTALGSSSGSSLFRGILKDSSGFWICLKFSLGAGSFIRFWEDTWVGFSSFSSSFPELVRLCPNQNAPVRKFWCRRSSSWKIPLQGPLTRSNSLQLQSLMQLLESISPNQSPDLPVWRLTPSGVFSVNSFYKFLSSRGMRWEFAPVVWKLAAPDRFRCFAWLLLHDGLHTGERLARKGCHISSGCPFCTCPMETREHLFFLCPFAGSIWDNIFSALSLDSHPSCFNHLWSSWRRRAFPKSGRSCWDQLAIAACASIWRERNGRIFDSKASSANAVLNRAHNLFSSWKIITPLSKQGFFSTLESSLRDFILLL